MATTAQMSSSVVTTSSSVVTSSSLSSAQAKAQAAAAARRGQVASSVGMQHAQAISYHQPAAVYAPVGQPAPAQGREVTKEVPVCAYDCRTVLVPKSVVEHYIVNETRMCAIQIPVTYQRAKQIQIPREISIPRPIVEKRVVRKMVPKVIQVEESYEIEVGMTEMKQFFIGADTSGDGMLSYAEWEAANKSKYDEATMRAMFVSSSSCIASASSR